MVDSSAIDWSRPIPLFPLQHCVLLPHATIPLHIFEPRYRAMMRHVLDSHGLIAMATFDGQSWQTQYAGNPPIKPIVCVGLVVRHERLVDGRYNLLLQGLARAAIRRELDSTPFRTALLDPLEPRPTMEIDLEPHRRRIEALLSDPNLSSMECIAAINHWLSGEIPTTALIDLAVLACCPQSEDRYAVLAEPEAARRAAWFERYLQRLREVRQTAAAQSPPRTEDGLGLN